jgi:trans-aconitate 2-methyltransferase
VSAAVDAGPGATADGWDPAQYARFAAERRQPFVDLVALCAPVPGGRVVDLGCGDGELTIELHRTLGAGHTVGVDSSSTMLAQAAERHRSEPGVTFEQGDIATWHGAPADLVFANASLHWVSDHRMLLGRLRRALDGGGQLAFQVPANFAHPSHRVALHVAAEEPFVSALGEDPPEDRGRHVLSPEEYATALDELGASSQTVRLQVYGHRLSSTHDVVEWVKGTLLTPYRRALPPALFARFVARYTSMLVDELGDRRPYFYPFPRILCWAQLPAQPPSGVP